MVIEWTDPALDDLQAIRDYIGRDSPYYARRFLERVFDAAEHLQTHPQLGRLVSEADRPDVRELVYQGYRIIYRISTDRIQILAVIHGSRDVAGAEAKPWDFD